MWSPQFVLWLLPLAVLAWPAAAVCSRSRWCCSCSGSSPRSYIVGVWHYLWAPEPDDGGGIEFETYAVAVFGRMLSLLAVGVLVVVDSVTAAVLDN